MVYLRFDVLLKETSHDPGSHVSGVSGNTSRTNFFRSSSCKIQVLRRW